MKESSSEYPENITGVKLPLLQLPKFSGNILEWSAFHDAFVATVDSHDKLSNAQRITHLKYNHVCMAELTIALKATQSLMITTQRHCKIYRGVMDANVYY